MLEKPKLMIVDDDPSSLRMAAEVLKDYFDLALSSSGVEANLFILKNPDIDLILLDINMPVMNGFEFLSLMKQDNRAISIPVAFFSSSQDKSDIQRCLKSGAVGYILKPFTSETLLEKVGGFMKDSLYQKVLGVSILNPIKGTKDHTVISSVKKLESITKLYWDLPSRKKGE